MRYKLTIAYHGAFFKGWQRQRLDTTVQGEIERALHAIFNTSIDVFGSGRTDQGVHATGQVAHIDISKPIDSYALMMGLNHFLRPYIAVIGIEPTHPTFHARFDATRRTYHYRLHCSQAPCPLMADRAWHINQPLCISSMKEASNHFIGLHDFSAFRSSACQSQHPIRSLEILKTLDDGQTWMIQARSFLHHQVRFMMGALVQIGLGKKKPEWIQTLLLNQNPIKPLKAPAYGLCLTQIQYPDTLYDTE